jgi:hypothetical protein
MFAIQPWATKSPKSAVFAAVALAVLALGAEAALVDRFIARPLAAALGSLQRPPETASRASFSEEIVVEGKRRVHHG